MIIQAINVVGIADKNSTGRQNWSVGKIGIALLEPPVAFAVSRVDREQSAARVNKDVISVNRNHARLKRHLNVPNRLAGSRFYGVEVAAIGAYVEHILRQAEIGQSQSRP
nr:hypothetical protein [Blastopirellula marina]